MSIVRRLVLSDRDAWLLLWSDYCAFYRAEIAEHVRDEVFERLCAGKQLLALVAADATDRPVGFAHLVFHPSTWSTCSRAYLEDLFVDRTERGVGVGRALIEKAYGEADARGADRVYWITQEYNGAARSLYDTLARRTSYVIYRR